jgi:hypothetical protein
VLELQQRRLARGRVFKKDIAALAQGVQRQQAALPGIQRIGLGVRRQLAKRVRLDTP